VDEDVKLSGHVKHNGARENRERAANDRGSAKGRVFKTTGVLKN